MKNMWEKKLSKLCDRSKFKVAGNLKIKEMTQT
jgi:hypothetical protein